VVIRIQEYHDKDYFQVEYYFDKLKERSTRKIVILALFDFFTQKAVPFTHKTYVYIAEIDSERYSSVAATRSTEGNRYMKMIHIVTIINSFFCQNQ